MAPPVTSGSSGIAASNIPGSAPAIASVAAFVILLFGAFYHCVLVKINIQDRH